MKKLIVIAGPTASGKTDLAIEIAQHFSTEIISADSRQCFRELHIGVAKPSAYQLQLIPHHFINSHTIYDEVSAGLFERYALDKIDEIFSKNDVAVCAGGTGLYIKALCEGIDEMPEIDKITYDLVEKKYQQNGLTWLQQEVQKTDPEFYNTGENQNPSRLLRALTFKLSSNQSILNFRKGEKKERKFEIVSYCIELKKEELYHRINERVNQMMEQGLLNEVAQLYSCKHLKSLHTVGYTELFDHLDGILNIDQAMEKIKQHSRNYAKRQVTWFKNQGSYIQMNPESIRLNLLKTNR